MRLAIFFLLGSVATGGCGDERLADLGPSSADQSAATARTAINASDDAAGESSVSASAAGASSAVERKIIYTVQLDISVTQFDGLQDRVEQLVKQVPGAYVSEATLSGTQGFRRHGQWTIRVPQAKYESLTADLRGLGEVRSESKRSQEMTEEFYDLTARLKNKKETEERLLKLEQDRTGELEHVLTVEREIGRVREEIERMEGRLKRLDDLTSLTTIQLSIAEIQTFQGEELAFTAHIAGVWNDSVGALRDLGKGLTLFAVGLTPWLPILALTALAARRLWRRLARGNFQPVAA